MIDVVLEDLETARLMLARGDLHRATQYARAAHSAAIELSFTQPHREVWNLVDQAEHLMTTTS